MATLPIVQGKQTSWLELCKRVLGPSASNVKTQPAGSLWGGYGSVTRISVDVDGRTHKLVAKQDTKAALDWLAAFHAFWWEQVPGQDNPLTHSAAVPETAAIPVDEVPTGLWDQGCYWHLDTRQEEFHSMSSSWRDLKAAASDNDKVLKGLRADGSKTTAHRTLIHGDFKAENVLFDSKMQHCAAYDFQYTGEGLGVRDVAYMFASSVDATSVLGSQSAERDLLQYYHNKLRQQLNHHGKGTAADNYSFEVMVAQYELCLVDYLRFMAGWGMWGSARWVRERCKHILPRLQEVIDVARSGW